MNAAYLDWEFWNFDKVVFESSNNTSNDIRYIVLTGDDGVDNSSTLNTICNVNPDQYSTVNGVGNKDAKTNFYGIYLKHLNVVYIDTPGCYYDETDWWKHIQKLTHVHTKSSK